MSERDLAVRNDLAQRTGLTNGPAFSLTPRTFAEAMEFAKLMADSDLVPSAYRGKPGNILVAIQMGYELGMTPMRAIRSIAVINGRASMYGDDMLAMVLASPVCEYVREQDSTDEKGICRVKRTDDTEEHVSTFSMADAKRAGLLEKDIWKKYTPRMLKMRARGFALRDKFTDVLAGLITAEEAMDLPGEDTTPQSPTPAPLAMTLKEKLKLKIEDDKAGGAMAGGSLDRNHQGQPPEVPPPSPHEEMLTAAALKVKQMYDRPAMMEEQAAPGGALAPILAQADNSGAPRETSGSGPSDMVITDGSAVYDLMEQVGLCETIKEWSGCENLALAIYEQGGFTAADWARYRGLSDQKKAQFTAKKK